MHGNETDEDQIRGHEEEHLVHRRLIPPAPSREGQQDIQQHEERHEDDADEDVEDEHRRGRPVPRPPFADPSASKNYLARSRRDKALHPVINGSFQTGKDAALESAFARVAKVLDEWGEG